MIVMVERDNRPPSMSVPLTVGALSLLTTLALCSGPRTTVYQNDRSSIESPVERDSLGKIILHENNYSEKPGDYVPGRK